MSQEFDVVVIGGGAAGMMCAIEAGRRGRSVLIIDHGSSLGEKIRISGGGRCNFTNVNTSPKNFISNNPHFCISALKSYTQYDFIELVDRYGIAYHEKALGQLFCDGSSKEIIDLLVSEIKGANGLWYLGTSVSSIERQGDGFLLTLDGQKSGEVSCSSLVIASGGRSIPKMGATGFGYKIAQQFGLEVLEPRPGLVPLVFDERLTALLGALSGNSLPAVVSCNGVSFEEAMLFTHRGLSGPVILQISSFWREGDELTISMLPGVDVLEELKAARQENGKRAVQTFLALHLPTKVAQMIVERLGIDKNLADLSGDEMKQIDEAVNGWKVKPIGSEGYRTAEVTLGGVDTAGLSSKTMEVNECPGLYFIGEVVDVTGWLGGYNFQWAWSSGFVAGQVV